MTTDKKIISAYDSMCPGNEYDSGLYDEDDQKELLAELRAIATGTLSDAVTRIEWWGTFDGPSKWNMSARSFVREFRRRLKPRGKK